MDKIDKIYKAFIAILVSIFIISLVLSCKAEAEMTTIFTPDGTMICSTQGGVTVCF